MSYEIFGLTFGLHPLRTLTVCCPYKSQSVSMSTIQYFSPFSQLFISDGLGLFEKHEGFPNPIESWKIVLHENIEKLVFYGFSVGSIIENLTF